MKNIFSSGKEYKKTFNDGLIQLAQDEGLGTFILAMANSTFSKEIFDETFELRKKDIEQRLSDAEAAKTNIITGEVEKLRVKKLKEALEKIQKDKEDNNEKLKDAETDLLVFENEIITEKKENRKKEREEKKKEDEKARDVELKAQEKKAKKEAKIELKRIKKIKKRKEDE